MSSGVTRVPVTQVLRSMTVVAWLVWCPAALIAVTQPPAAQDEFVPISELPPTEQIAAAPLLIGAYVFVLAVLFAYVVSVARRLTSVQRDMDRLAGDIAKRGH